MKNPECGTNVPDFNINSGYESSIKNYLHSSRQAISTIRLL